MLNDLLLAWNGTCNVNNRNATSFVFWNDRHKQLDSASFTHGAMMMKFIALLLFGICWVSNELDIPTSFPKQILVFREVFLFLVLKSFYFREVWAWRRPLCSTWRLSEVDIQHFCPQNNRLYPHFLNQQICILPQWSPNSLQMWINSLLWLHPPGHHFLNVFFMVFKWIVRMMKMKRMLIRRMKVLLRFKTSVQF